ncbi:hypothetical protein G7009_07690 [Pseudomonas capeferrum]|uniref:hypothetical protein n=1 Tax=Pseudomonas capeferrum TaxID=1495066 RepID=UPI0015E479EC|nr:hypothetical protein [Pseudomonas capeferrum]MBA1201643.1 hypothetical protein [Pseudomonas capeferrum]
MKEIVPDPPLAFDSPAGKTLARAIYDGTVPFESTLRNLCHYLRFAYNDGHRAFDATDDEDVLDLLATSLQALPLAWGQADALADALEPATWKTARD